MVPPSVWQGTWAAMSVQSKTAALFLQNKVIVGFHPLSPMESHERDTKAKSLKFFTDAFYLTCLQLDMKTVDFTGCVHGFEWCLIGVRVRNPLCVEHFTNLLSRKKKQQRLAIYCLRNAIFGDMAMHRSRYLVIVNQCT